MIRPDTRIALPRPQNIILITGMAGVGKSSSCEELEARGYKTINLDTYPGLSYWGDDQGEPSKTKETNNPDWLSRYYWRWRGQILEDLILGCDSSEPLFLEGRARNQEEFFGYFGTVALLRATEGPLRTRLNNPARNHNLGKNKVIQDFWVARLPSFEKKALDHGAIEIQTDRLSISQVTDRILEACLT